MSEQMTTMVIKFYCSFSIINYHTNVALILDIQMHRILRQVLLGGRGQLLEVLVLEST